MSVRIIPRLDIKAPNLVKGVHLEGLRVLGQPWCFARHYYEQGADELLYVDVVASLFQRNSILKIVERTAREIFIPLTVGGGLRSVDDIYTVLRAGADKVLLNTAAIQNPPLVQQAARRFGSSTIVISIEAKKRPDGTYEAYIDNGRQRTGVEVLSWARQAAELGAGEIVITSIDREGTGNGFDLELTRAVAEAVTVPVIACGGAGQINHVRDVLIEGKADAVSAASLFHYDFLAHHDPFCNDDSELPKIASHSNHRERHAFSRIEPASLQELKGKLVRSGIDCRVRTEVAHA